MPHFIIRPAVTADLSKFADIEEAAAIRFRELDISAPEGLEDITIEEYQSFKINFVAVQQSDNTVCGFVAVNTKDQQAYIEEISVHPNAGRQGVGRRLMESAIEWAKASGYQSIYLTTYRDVPFNAPFYQKLGFVEATPETLGPDMAKTRKSEQERGFDQRPRIAMCLSLRDN